jgi:hypothetical protein
VWTAETVLVCALALLHRSVDSFPPIQLESTRPADVSPLADGYVRDGDARIHLVITTAAFTQAMRADYRCGNLQALRKIASVVVHEEWHLRHGHDEAGAYVAQLSALLRLEAGPGSPLYAEVQRSMRAVRRASRPAGHESGTKSRRD